MELPGAPSFLASCERVGPLLYHGNPSGKRPIPARLCPRTLSCETAQTASSFSKACRSNKRGNSHVHQSSQWKCATTAECPGRNCEAACSYSAVGCSSGHRDTEFRADSKAALIARPGSGWQQPIGNRTSREAKFLRTGRDTKTAFARPFNKAIQVPCFLAGDLDLSPATFKSHHEDRRNGSVRRSNITK